MNSMESPFHRGEQRLQEQAGVRSVMEQFGRRVIRDHLPEQHRDFYRQLPFLVVGYSDAQGWPWASLMAGESGFMQSPDAESLTLANGAVPGDPIASSLHAGTPLGALGIELHTRRRNRFSAVVESANSSALSLSMRQTFGNCPQYIQAHKLSYDPVPEVHMGPVQVVRDLTQDDLHMIESSDTFFVASQTLSEQGVSSGADVSHRGGQPGFVKVERNEGGAGSAGVWQLTVPDYPGNNHFNTLGNFVLNPRAGLLFWDLQRRDLLMLTGTVEILDDHPDLVFFDGAQRFWRFTLKSGLRLKHRLPLRSRLGGVSPNTAMTGTWQEVREAKLANQQRQSFLPYRVLSRKQESASVVSFELQPENGRLPAFKAGQYLTLRVTTGANGNLKQLTRTYTVSCAPGAESYRISVKRERGKTGGPDGQMSSYLHDFIEVGDTVEVKAPQGDFHWGEESNRSVVMIAAGIGITPMLAMAQQALRDQVRLRRFRAVTLVLVTRSKKEQAFHSELVELAARSQGYIRVFWCLTQPEPELVLGRDYHLKGSPAGASLQSVLPLDDYDFYLCGPGGFMQSMYDELRSLGVAEARIASEAFGPSALLPKVQVEKADTEGAALSSAVRLRDASGVELAALNWVPEDGSLLEFAENHGVQPAFSCRSGRCGSCVADLEQGRVVHDAGAIDVDEHQVLLCSARPATDALVVRIKET